MVRNIRSVDSWVPSTVVEQNGSLSYLVQVSGDRLWKRHVDHIRQMNDSPQREEIATAPELPFLVPRAPHVKEASRYTNGWCRNI